MKGSITKTASTKATIKSFICFVLLNFYHHLISFFISHFFIVLYAQIPTVAVIVTSIKFAARASGLADNYPLK